ncbi:D-alanyl-D-alanine carboxypeptidase family protein [Weissella koreensis]|uniref:D-alanyl-D-alanine carboxypeptidase family protein n=1 Tax=Weissella koreensis TaxID=165096 RepID=UPI0005A541F5|nr:serine hydrolase [Weissella koreensis]
MKINFFKGIIVMFLGLILVQPMSNAAALTPNSSAPAEITVDVASGQVIASKNDQERLPIASLSKLIVIYLVEQSIQSGKFTHESTMKVSSKVADFSQDLATANVELSEDKTYTVEQLETAALVASANGAAIALADKVCGSQEQYYQVANQLLTSWGIKNANIISASGLSENDMGSFQNKNLDTNLENKLSAREVAKVSWHLVRDYPDIFKITSQTEVEFPKPDDSTQTLKNTNELLWSSKYKFKGLKTGTTADHSQNVVGYTTIDNRPVLTVVLNASEGQDFTETENMLDQIQKQTNLVKVTANQKMYVKNAKNKQSLVELKPQKDVVVFAKERRLATQQTFKVNSHADAPLNQNEWVATQRVLFKNKSLNDYLSAQPSLRYETVNAVKVANPLVLISRSVMTWIEKVF